MPLDVNAAMDAIGVRLRTITGLSVYDYPSMNPAVPAAIIGHPDTVTYDVSYARGADMAVFQVLIIVGDVMQDDSRDELEAYRAGAGAKSVKAAVEADPGLAGAAKTTRVTQATAGTITITGIDFATATFDVEVYA